LSTAAAPRRRRTLQVAIGVVLVILAFVGVLVFSRLSGGATGSTQTTILGTSRDIKTATPLTADDLVAISVDTLPTGAVRDKSLLVGKVSRHDISKGSAVLDSDVASPAIGTAARLYFALPAGKVALNIPASDISPYVQPGDQIDIIASPRSGPGSTGGQYKTTLKGLRVLSVGAPQAAAGAAPAGVGNLIVEVNLQDAEAIQFLVKNTDFTYVLKSPLDQAAANPDTTGVDLQTFKQIYGFK
jgi:Flp pilus assembly protein CpaB